MKWLNQVPKPQQLKRKPHLALYLVIALTAFVLYGNTLSNGYVLDDFSVIKENNIVNQGVKNLGMIFKTSYRTGYLNVNDGLYRPLSLAMFHRVVNIAKQSHILGHFINILIYILGTSSLQNNSKITAQHESIPYFGHGYAFCWTSNSYRSCR